VWRRRSIHHKVQCGLKKPLSRVTPKQGVEGTFGGNENRVSSSERGSTRYLKDARVAAGLERSSARQYGCSLVKFTTRGFYDQTDINYFKGLFNESSGGDKGLEAIGSVGQWPQVGSVDCYCSRR
jgi:hypothetical protein